MKVDQVLILVASIFLAICIILAGAVTQIANLLFREYLLSTTTVIFAIGATIVILTELIIFIKKMLA